MNLFFSCTPLTEAPLLDLLHTLWPEYDNCPFLNQLWNYHDLVWKNLGSTSETGECRASPETTI